MKIKGLTYTLSLLALSAAANAEQATPNPAAWQDKVRVHGFATQSYLHSDANNFFGQSDSGSFDFRELGVNALWRPISELQFAAQLVARSAGSTDDGAVRVDYALMDYAFARSATGTTGLRLGRMINPYGFYNDTRDIAATRPSILLPQSIYFDVNRNLALSSDGVQGYHEYGTDAGQYTFQLGVTKPRTQDPDLEPSVLFQDGPGKLEGTVSWMGRALYEHNFGRIRVGLTAAEVNADYEPGVQDPVGNGEFSLRPYILSAEYNLERWSFTAEYAKRTTELSGFQSLPDLEFTGTSYYAQSIYRFAPNWQAFARFDELIWNDDDKDGREYAALTGRPAHSRFAKDWTLGLRWDPTPKLMLRAEWHSIDGTGWLSSLENPSSTERHWNLFSLSASLTF